LKDDEVAFRLPVTACRSRQRPRHLPKQRVRLLSHSRRSDAAAARRRSFRSAGGAIGWFGCTGTGGGVVGKAPVNSTSPVRVNPVYKIPISTSPLKLATPVEIAAIIW